MLKLSQSIKALRAGKRAPSILLRRCPLKTLEKKLLSVDIPVCSFCVLCCIFCIALIFLEIGGRSLRFWITTRFSTSSFATCSSEKEEVVDSIFLVSFIADVGSRPQACLLDPPLRPLSPLTYWTMAALTSSQFLVRSCHSSYFML